MYLLMSMFEIFAGALNSAVARPVFLAAQHPLQQATTVRDSKRVDFLCTKIGAFCLYRHPCQVTETTPFRIDSSVP